MISPASETMVFVPAIMSAGLLFSIVTLVRDAARWGGTRARERRSTIEAHAVVNDVLGNPHPPPSETGVLSRSTYLATATMMVAGAAYISIGSTANFLRDGGYVTDISWLLAVSLMLAALLGFLGGVSLIVFLRWPDPPAWTLGPLRGAPLTATPGKTTVGPSWELSASLLAAALATMVVALIVGTQRSGVYGLDQPILDWLVETEWLDRLAPIDPFGSTVLSVAFVVLIGLSGFRCRLMALVYPVVFVVSWAATEALQEVVARPRPHGLGSLESFPSGHMVQATLLAGLVPYALGVLLADRRAVVLSRAGLGAAVIGTALHRIHRLDHWPLDAVGGVLVGATIVLLAYWILEHDGWHRRCTTCPASPSPARPPWSPGVFEFAPAVAHRIGLAGVTTALGAAVALGLGTVVVGLPSDPEGAGFGSAVFGPIQIGFAVLIGLGGLLALRWRALAAFVMALAATGIGLVASVEYSPSITFFLTAALLIPAILVWLAWQHTETVGSITALAVVTVGLLAISAAGSQEIYGHFFGPTHPESSAAGLDSAAEWLWLGAVATDSAAITAGGLDGPETYRLSYWVTGAAPQVVDATSGEDGIARFVLDNLKSATTYSYRVDAAADPQPDGREDAAFATQAHGAHDVVIVAGSCARVASNGSVFDAIVAEEPDLYLAIGDLHYANLSSSAPEDHIDAYARSLGQPAQAGLFSSIPTAYVWDDHDYGPNDAGADSPSREAVSTAYRRAVPSIGVDPDPNASIAHAFSVGRVRVVMTDTRSQRDMNTMLGPTQLEWLIDELVDASNTHAVVVWANPSPWIAEGGPTSDNWSAHPDERRTIAEALAAAGVDNLVMVSGDAHMVAIDDGTNSGYASDGTEGFPVLHAAALDRPGSVKGGPYSHGVFPGGGQYGRIEIHDDGGAQVSIQLSGHDWNGATIVSLRFDVPAGPMA